MVTGELVFTVRHKGALMQRQASRGQVAHEVHKVLKRVTLNVEFPVRPVFHHGGNFIDIVSADVTLVRPWMHRDAVRTGFQAQARGTHHIRNPQMARIAQQRYLVDIDRQRHAAWCG